MTRVALQYFIGSNKLWLELWVLPLPSSFVDHQYPIAFLEHQWLFRVAIPHFLLLTPEQSLGYFHPFMYVDSVLLSAAHIQLRGVTVELIWKTQFSVKHHIVSCLFCHSVGGTSKRSHDLREE